LIILFVIFWLYVSSCWRCNANGC